RDMGLETHVVEFAPRLMAVQVDEGGGRLLRQKIEDLGVKVHTGKNTQVIEAGETTRHVMRFADGESLETDIVLFSAGIGERGGIVVDNQCRTSDPHIFAIGECALWNGQIFGLVAPGYDMARVAVDTLLAGEDAPASAFEGADMSTKLKLMGVDVASIGDAHARSQGAKVSIYTDEHAGVYKKLVSDSSGKKVLGAVLVGDAADYGNLLQLMLNGIDIPGKPDQLILPLSEGGAPMLGVDALPESATICSCNNITKGALCGAIAEGAQTLGELKSCTTAGTSCGGCAALVKNVLDAELEKMGVDVVNHLCEHFSYSRQELEHLIRIEGHKSFNSVRDAHGNGLGCDICKPTVASILASTWNEHVLQPHLAGLQDTNDYFMANLQKDGTYSVVPRVPGGEITPEKLIVIGQVAQKYGLYTKITGGQRIDLFGAQVHQLPLIWKELVDAGMESGHAYGKAVRTVKSCVGSTWCRYGQQDSVGMSILLEERYRGIRAPHKLKFAVSGCTRECAEAQCKDIGVIATERGWNLYVAGNGGMKPRHADLFATDLDDATLLQYIDRFLMLYIRTADRLQRTARWLEELDGGLDYVKDVVIHDSLGLGVELETQMQSLVDTYVCEWKATLEDEHKLKRFRHFVNSDEADSNVVFVQERGQIRPATAEERASRKAA
ncbi:MAG: nitrite reductase large subunit NirB, partial [Oceanococcaceae bacterium]